MPNSRSAVRRPRSLLACLFAVSAMVTISACNSTKPNDYKTPKETSQVRCTESHSADGTCAAAEADEE